MRRTYAEKQGSSRVPSENENSNEGFRDRVLIVEDALNLRTVFERAIHALDPKLKIEWATTVDEVIQNLNLDGDEREQAQTSECKLTPYRFIVSNLYVSGIANGIDLWRKAKQVDPALPVLLVGDVTADHFIQLIARDHFGYGGAKFLPKPFTVNELQGSIGAFMNRTQPFVNDAPERARLEQEKKIPRRRRSERFNVDFLKIEVQFDRPEFCGHSEVVNVSKGGIFIRMHGAVPRVRDHVRFTLTSKYDPDLKVSGTGDVRWVRFHPDEEVPEGYGIQLQRWAGNGASIYDELLAELRRRKGLV